MACKERQLYGRSQDNPPYFGSISSLKIDDESLE